MKTNDATTKELARVSRHAAAVAEQARKARRHAARVDKTTGSASVQAAIAGQRAKARS
jgi:hypothetical protein